MVREEWLCAYILKFLQPNRTNYNFMQKERERLKPPFTSESPLDQYSRTIDPNEI
jgi:hypothetical protein